MKPINAKAPLAVPVHYANARGAVMQLGDDAAKGSREAAVELVQIGILAASLLEGLHRQYPEFIKDAASQYPEFPINYTWKRTINEDRIVFAKSLPLSSSLPFKTNGLKLDDVFHAIENGVWRHFQFIRQQGIKTKNIRQKKIVQKILRLQPIAKDSAKKWASVFAEFHVNFDGNPCMTTENVFFYLASPTRDLERRKRLARGRMDKKYDPNIRHKPGEPDITALRRAKWEHKIGKMAVTTAEFQRRLAQELTKRLERMLKK